MKIQILFSMAVCATFCAAAPCRADNAGQADLDRAEQLKISATTVNDLTEVIKLCESAQTKGLDKTNTVFAKHLQASSMLLRATTWSAQIFAAKPSANWVRLRTMALADLDKAIALDAKQPQALYLIARLNLLPGGDARRAAEVLDEAIKQSSEEPPLRAQALTLRSELQINPKLRLADLNEAVRLSPHDPTALRARGALLADLDKPEDGLADLQRALESEPKDLTTHVAKALVLAKLKRYDEGLASLDTARKLDPTSAFPLLQRARIRVLQKKFALAIEDLDKALAIQPGNAAIYLLRSAIHVDAGKPQAALADADKALELKPGMPEAVRTRAALLLDAGKGDQARKELEVLHKADPQDPLTVFELGGLYHQQKRYRKAVELFTGYLASHPKQAVILRSRGDALLSLGRRGEAIVDYQSVLSINPKEPTTLNNLAWILATAPEKKVRDGKRAIDLATEACKLTEFKEAYILSTLAAAYAEAGDFASAVKWSSKAVEIGDKKHGEALAKELASYKAGKPWREVTAAEPADKKPDSPKQKSDAAKPTAKKPAATGPSAEKSAAARP